MTTNTTAANTAANTTVVFDDQLGSRDIQHKNLLVAKVGDEQVIFEFSGDIPGVARVVKTRKEKNGKWSFTEWTVELAPGIEGFSFSQDWETGQYLGSSWAHTRDRFREAARRKVAQPLEDAAIDRYVRARFKREFVDKLDEKEGVLAQPSEAALAEILSAQQARAEAEREYQGVAVEVAALAQAEADRKEAVALKDRAAAIKQAMSKGMSLADLQAMMR